VLEGAQATLQQREDKALKLNGELVQISVSLADARQSLEEQEATVLGLQQAAEDACQALEAEKKQVEGKSSSVPFRSPIRLALSICLLGIRSRLSFSCSWLSGLRVTLGNSTAQAQAMQTAYNSSQHELEELRTAALEVCQEFEECEAQAGSSLASRLRALDGHVSQRMRRALHMGVKKALGVVASHYQVDFEAVSSGYIVSVGVEDEVAMNRADALAATAADMLAEDFTDFLLPDAPDAGDPQT
jgi:hypothetical protein